MSYLSIEFGLLFIAFFAVYWGACALPWLQNLLLLAASYWLMYSFGLHALLVLLGYTFAVYVLALLAESFPGRRWIYGLLGLLVFGCFYVFKYQDFLVGSAQAGLDDLGIPLSLPLLEVLLPVGLSFYAFHSVSYVVSVNRGEIRAGSPLDVMLYLAFFPSVVAGPVNRARHLLPQLNPEGPRQVIEPQRALGLIAMAITKLFLLGSWLGNTWVDPVFQSPAGHSAGELLLAVYGYSFLIYLNFSGYTNLVTGIGLLLGFELPKNFDHPYVARNLKEFWGRWHISLSTFIRDYVYIPLGGNRKGFWRGNFNMFAAMLISGLWHGASINFIIWGALHGLGLWAYKLFERWVPERPQGRVADLCARLMTFHYVALAWIFFRCASLDDAWDMLSGLSDLSGMAGATGLSLLACLLLVAAYPALVAATRRTFETGIRLPWLLYPLPLAAFIAVVIYVSPSGVPGFIYANF